MGLRVGVGWGGNNNTPNSSWQRKWDKAELFAQRTLGGKNKKNGFPHSLAGKAFQAWRKGPNLNCGGG